MRPPRWCCGSVSASGAGDRGFDPRSGHTKDFKNGRNDNKCEQNRPNKPVNSCSKVVFIIIGDLNYSNAMVVIAALFGAQGCGVSITTDWLVSG